MYIFYVELEKIVYLYAVLNSKKQKGFFLLTSDHYYT